MARYDQYMLSQLLSTFGFFALVLILVYWINRAVSLFDTLIADGQTVATFFELTALSLPALIRIVLPLAAFGASLYATNRLVSDSELTVLQATGVSPWRLARPVFLFGMIVTVLVSLLTHILVPAAAARLSDRQSEIAADAAAVFLRPGRFVTPTAGVTLFIGDITPEGEIRDLFLSDRRDPTEEMSYTAARAFLVRTDAGPQLVMIDGMAQSYDPKTRRLGTTGYGDLAYDVGDLIAPSGNDGRSWREVPTRELLFPTPGLEDETGQSAGRLVAEGHTRFAEPLLAVTGALLGFATLLMGGFSRFGAGKQVLGAILIVIGVKLIEGAVTGAVRGDSSLWPLIYLPGLAGFATVGLMLLRASAPRRRPRGLAA